MTTIGYLVRRDNHLAQDAFGQSLRDRLLDLGPRDGRARASVDIMESTTALRSGNGLRADGAAPDGIVWLSWTDGALSDVDVHAIVAPIGAVTGALTVERRVAWDDLPPSAVPGPTPGVKQTALLVGAPGIDVPAFRAAYRAHQALTRVHMPGVARYVQNDVIATDGPASADVIAVSELWFASVEDFHTRYWAGPDSPAEFRSHETFLDLPRACSVVGREWVLA
jgi:hypothetical protein